ncbi:acetoacetate decarboxylase family protein [Actinopolymorpha sp. NPDC004070]|uniref:acetoacetate decarboxylase family protein n=1 Tax=Actinopolymorpha sp. NPDC004070 TaxID=3154548 RepID=UPI0033B98664
MNGSVLSPALDLVRGPVRGRVNRSLLRAAGLALRLVPSPVPRRQRREAGRHALVDGVPFVMPVDSRGTPSMMAAFSIDGRAAAAKLPGDELHPVRLANGRGVLLVTVLSYQHTDIGRYIEYSLGIMCTHGTRQAPRLLPGLLRGQFGTGLYILDLPVSTEISVKGGKGIWGMPKHRAPLSFEVTDSRVAAQYDSDGLLAARVEIDRPSWGPLPLQAAAVAYAPFRGMLMRSTIYFAGDAFVAVAPRATGRLVLGDAPVIRPLHDLGIGEFPLFTAFLPAVSGVLDDHVESWFLTSKHRVRERPEGLESVVDLGLSEEWPPAPVARV